MNQNFPSKHSRYQNFNFILRQLKIALNSQTMIKRFSPPHVTEMGLWLFCNMTPMLRAVYYNAKSPQFAFAFSFTKNSQTNKEKSLISFREPERPLIISSQKWLSKYLQLRITISVFEWMPNGERHRPCPTSFTCARELLHWSMKMLIALLLPDHKSSQNGVLQSVFTPSSAG